MTVILGLDIGIGSCGWALVRSAPYDILACGSRGFTIPEHPKDKKLTNAVRREARGQRRVIRRRRLRLQDVKRTLANHGLPLPGGMTKGTPAGQVWQWRADALQRALAPEELAAVLIHIAKHRGFKSNSKRDRDNKSEGGALLKAIAERGLKSAAYPSFGTMLARDPDFAGQKRNRANQYRLTPLRQDIENETTKIFERQRALGQTAASQELEAKFCAIAFRQRPLQDSIKLLGKCQLDPSHRRASKFAPSFERFRYLQKLANLRISVPGAEPRALSDAERQIAIGLMGRNKNISYKKLRKALNLADYERFEGLSRKAKDPESSDLGKFEGTALLRETLGEVHWANLTARQPGDLDDAIAAIQFNEMPETIEQALGETGLAAADRDCLMDNLGSFARLKGAAHISAFACRKLLPHLEAGADYATACRLSGYDHTAVVGSRLDAVNNPVVKKTLRECIRQIEVVIQTFGLPDEIHLEMARDVGKSVEERNAIAKGNDDRRTDRRRRRQQFEELFERQPSDDELAAFEHWQEQHQRCPYCDHGIDALSLVASKNDVQIDHILPYSRSGDNSFRNKVLVHTGCNQDKKNRTPFEWFGADKARWEAFETAIEAHNGLHKQKKRNLKNKTFALRESEYRDRHLNDTRYAMRVLRQELRIRFGVLGENERFFAVPGAVTAMCRRAWGLDSLKKDNVLADRDHALDAMVVATVTRSMLQRATKDYQKIEIEGRGRFIPNIHPPMDDAHAFRRLLADQAQAVFVSRSETRRGRGALHDATLYGIREGEDGPEQITRKAVVDLKAKDLERLAGDPVRQETLRRMLSEWLDAAAAAGMKPAKYFETSAPRMHAKNNNGPVIRCVRLVRNKQIKEPFRVRRGESEAIAENTGLASVDVFKWEGGYFLMPIRNNMIHGDRTKKNPPQPRLIHRKKMVDPHQFTYLFTLYPGSFFTAVTASGKVHEGYFRTLDSTSGELKYGPQENYMIDPVKRFKTKTLSSFVKYQVDRLGNRSTIKQETRVWHGVALSSPKPPD